MKIQSSANKNRPQTLRPMENYEAAKNSNFGLHLPLIFFCVMTFFPYIFYSDTASFQIILAADTLTHILVSAFILFFIFFFYTIGYRTVSRGQFENFTNFNSPLVEILINFILVASFLTYVYQILIVGPVAFSSGFLEARDEFDIPGVGILLRMPMIVFPFIFLSYRIVPKIYYRLLVIYIIFCILRAIVMSERLAATEAIVTSWCCLFIKGKAPKLKTLIVVSLCLGAFFAVIQYLRFETLKTVDSHASDDGFLAVTLVYYADTLNKFYLILFGLLQYPMTFYDGAVKVFYEDRNTLIQQMNVFLTYQASISGYISPALNNPGGLAQDLSDFGAGLFLFVIALKFYIFGFILRNAKRFVLCATLLPLVMITILEYPRFFYLYTSNSIFLIFVSIIVSAFPQLGYVKVSKTGLSIKGENLNTYRPDTKID